MTKESLTINPSSEALVNAILGDDMDAANSLFKSAVAEKLADRFDSMKIELAQRIN